LDRLKIHIRVALILALGIFMFFGPFYRQVLKGRNDYFPKWTMFSGAGIGVVRVEFFIEDAEGKRRKLDRYAVGEYGRYLINGKSGLDSKIRDVVRRNRGKGTLIVNGEIATRREWETIYSEQRFDLDRHDLFSE
jgi:hypothetical protein